MCKAVLTAKLNDAVLYNTIILYNNDNESHRRSVVCVRGGRERVQGVILQNNLLLQEGRLLQLIDLSENVNSNKLCKTKDLEQI